MSQKKTQLFNPLNGNINVTGVVTASSFSGDGSGLTGVASTDNIQTATPATFLSDVSISGVTTVGVVTSGTSVSASQIYGDVITATSGIDAIGIQSGGIDITTGIITAINFTGSGNTVTYDSSTKVVSVSVGSGSGLSTTGVTGIQTAAFFSNPSMIHESITLDEGNNNYGVFGPLGVAIGATITVGTANTLTIA
jgi:hypothetical protein